MAGQRPQKRLFTPEIKRYLKDWLVRRRENPYPNREEKKYLSHETGLTYTQVPTNTNIVSMKTNMVLKIGHVSPFCRVVFHVCAYQQPIWTRAKNCYLHINRHYFCH